jgi:tRNA ligase
MILLFGCSSLWQLCDDGFEEHVLAYAPEKTGLHLHGINKSTKAFKTLPQAEVDAFADEWGFIKTHSIILDSAAKVKDFTDNVAKTGIWNGEAVEGFVIRTHVVKPKEGVRETAASPYPPRSTFFFKVKFDEPYMMYRDWREFTETLLSTKGSLNDAKLSTMRMKRIRCWWWLATLLVRFDLFSSVAFWLLGTGDDPNPFLRLLHPSCVFFCLAL